MSVRKKIIFAYAFLAFALLVVVSILQYSGYSEQLTKSVDQLILEQASLIINKLDQYRIIDQNSFIGRTIYQLENVEAVAVFDRDCQFLMAKPSNSGLKSACGSSDSSLLLYENDNVFSQSSGTVKYIYIKKASKVDDIKYSVLLRMLGAPILLIVFFTGLLIFLLNRFVLQPIEHIGDLVSSGRKISEISSFNKTGFPKELQPIIDALRVRDNVIEGSQKKLVHQVELEAYSLIGRQVSHDIKSPLGALKAAINSIQSKPQAARSLMTRAVDRMDGILRDLEKSGKAIAPSVLTFDLLKEVEDIVFEKQTEFSNIEIKLKSSITLAERLAVGDRVAVSRILSNIINNAIESGAREIEISIEEPKENLFFKIVISDNGCGIMTSDIDNVLHKGYTTKSEGSGLGLSHAKDEMKRFKGELRLESEVGVGTRVELSFLVK